MDRLCDSYVSGSFIIEKVLESTEDLLWKAKRLQTEMIVPVLYCSICWTLVKQCVQKCPKMYKNKGNTLV